MGSTGKDSRSGKDLLAEIHIGEHDGEARGTIRIVIADDDPAVVHEIGDLLGTRFDVVATAANGLALIEAVRQFLPDLVVTDISMPQMNGIQAARRITSEFPAVKVVMLSVHDDSDYVDAAFDAGASGYVLKLDGGQELIPAIESVLAGVSYRPAGARGPG